MATSPSTAAAPGPPEASAPRIELRGVGKTYNPHRKHGGTIKQTLLDSLSGGRRAEPTVHALEGIDLTVRPGEAIGIVGANGSGKSTLLKIIAGITEPTAGTVKVRGRVLGVIELGAGFHPDLSGEENVELQGAIYGMSAAQVAERIDRIFDYAGIAEFRATPLKHYSSGMIVRLGFAIAVQCEPDILLVDEVLAVGDRAFQLQCLATIGAMRARGTTIVLVTHQIDHAERACERLLWLKDGRVQAQGDALEILQAYYQDALTERYGESEGEITKEHVTAVGYPARFGSGEARITRLRALDAEGRARHNFAPGEPIAIEVDFRCERELEALDCWLVLDFHEGSNVAYWCASDGDAALRPAPREGTFRMMLPEARLLPGRFILTAALSAPGRFDKPYDMHFRLHQLTIEGSGEATGGPAMELTPKVTWLKV